MKKYYRALRLAFSLWGTANWYLGIDKPTFWQWLYAWRISPKTAWSIANIWLWEPQKDESNKEDENHGASFGMGY